MKKKSCLTLALILVMVQLLSVFAILPVGADNAIKTYDVKKSTVAPTVNGAKEEIWGFFEPQALTQTNTVGTYSNAAHVATVRMLYVENAGLIDVYLLIETTNATNWGGERYSRVIVEGEQLFNLRSGGAYATSASYNYEGQSTQTGTSVIYEHHFQLTAEQAASFTFDTYVLDGASGNRGDFSWADTHEYNHETSSKGTLTFSDTVNYPKTASVYRSAFAPVVDGEIDAIWSAFDATEKFTYRYTVGTYERSDALVATAKLMYVENGDLIDVYVLIEANNTISNWSTRTRSTILLNGNNPVHLSANSTTPSGSTSLYSYKGVSAWKKFSGNPSGRHFIAEHYFQLTKEQAQSFTFDMYVADGVNNDYCSYSWGDTHSSNHGASQKCTLNFVDEDVISVESAVGASVRVDVATPKQSGIRFATTVEAEQIAALTEAGATVTTGTLVLPTNNLKNVTDFTKEGLTAAGLVEGAHYYDIVNEGNEWVAGEEGTWYGTLYDIKNFTRQFSAIGYVTVTIDGVSVTYYGQYEDSYARSVADVADAALKDTGANWSTDEIDILNGFCGK